MKLSLALGCALTALSSLALADPPRAQANESRVKALIARMTLEEKLALIHGQREPAETYQGQAGWLAGVPRLGIPPLRLADGPHGVLTRVDSGAPPATLALAATFSTEDARVLGAVVGRNARARGIDVVLQPYINIMRDVSFARANNVYGEDPFLTGAIGAGFVRGAQGEGVMAQAKHYVGYEGPNDVTVDEQALHEIYAAPFRDVINAGVSSLMCSYNKLNGPYSCGNPKTMTGILRDELGFKGFVTSDWGADHGAEFIAAGLDMDMPGDMGPPMNSFTPPYFANIDPLPPPPKMDLSAYFASAGNIPEEVGTKPPAFNMEKLVSGYSPTLKVAFGKKSVTMAMVDRAAARVLGQYERFGFLDGRIKHSVTPEPIAQNAADMERVAADSAVLLKNDGVLPLKSADLADTVFIGAGARQTFAVVYPGERATGYPEREIGVVKALKSRTGVDAPFAVGEDMAGTAIPAAAFEGLTRTSGSAAQPDAVIDYTNANGKALHKGTHAVWKGNLNAVAAGDYDLDLAILGASGEISVDGKKIGGTSGLALHGDVLHANTDDVLPTPDGLDSVRRQVTLSAGKHSIEVKADADTSGNPVQVRLAWVTPEQRAANRAAAIDAAHKAKTAVVFVWSRGKPDPFALPGDQNVLIADIAAANPNTIVILNTGGPVAMPWLDKVKGVMEMWYSGDEGGWALADLLTGKRVPAGRLPFTWPVKLTDMPANNPAYPERSMEGVGGKSRYSEGIFVGYRWFDQQNKAPLYPFGYGLTYARFGYSGLHVIKTANGGLTARFTLHNTGRVTADEVPQLYLGPPAHPSAGAQFAVRALAAFTRVTLKPGEARAITLNVEPRRLQYWSVRAHKWIAAPQGRVVYIGSSSRDIKLEAKLDREKPLRR